MYILTVAPITRGMLKGHLTYFAKEAAPVGSVLMVPLRNQKVPALVIDTKEAALEKTTLRSSEYTIRKITETTPQLIWSPAFSKAATETARYFAQGLGETFLALTPKAILDAYLTGLLPAPRVTEKATSSLSAIQESTVVRYEHYQRLIRESFVHGDSIFICLPTSEDVARAARILGRGIEPYTFSFHSSITKKRLLENWGKALAERHAIVVIGTPQYLMFPRFFKTIILDEEHARAWKTLVRPHIDLRVFAESYAKEAGSHLIFGAPILRPETHLRLKEGSISEWNRIASHARATLATDIIDPRIEEKMIREKTGQRTLQILSAPLRALLEQAERTGESVLLLTARKGLSPITICGDCGTTVRCPECDTPLVIHKKENERRIFSCHSCGFMRTPEEGEHETCPACRSWRLEGLGIGTERVEEEVATLFPSLSRFVFDGDRVHTAAQARSLSKDFQKERETKRGAILIASPMAIPYLEQTDHTAIVSIDSLFAIPDFRMNERIFALLLAIREKTTKTLLVQTRMDDTTLLAQGLIGNLSDFTDQELALRKTFSYPPFGTIIKITVRGKRETLPQEIERLRTYLTTYEPITPNTMSREPSNVFRMHLIMKLAKGSYPNEELIAKLRTLPPHMSIEVNPDHLL